jgi:hypothetical protein
MAAVLAAMAIVAGCIMTGTAVITARLAPDEAGQTIRITELNYVNGELEVDLTKDQVFQDYKDDIKNIDNIGFYLSARNQEFFNSTFQLFFVDDTSANYASVDDILQDTIVPEVIFTGLTLPSQETTTVEWEKSLEFVSGLDIFKSYISDGVFSLYPAAIPRDNFDIVIDSLVIIVTLTGSK